MAAQIVAGSVVVNMLADNRQFNAALNRTTNIANNFAIRVENVFGRFQDRIIGTYRICWSYYPVSAGIFGIFRF
ncbi:hypothetical protein FACS18942_03000 [Planctomycetales bacterium]|nr:hypothetical protein FACS18942_03000 [Planctomycetales bacterium]